MLYEAMGYDIEGVLNSEKPYRVLSVLNEEGEDYPAQMADKIDVVDGTIRNLLRELRQEPLEFVERGKRNHERNIQYYRLNIDGIYTYWYEELHKRMDDNIERLEQEIEDIEDENNPQFYFLRPEKEEWEDKKQRLNEYHEDGTLKLFFQFWKQQYFEVEQESTLQSFLFEDLRTTLKKVSRVEGEQVWEEWEEMEAFPDELGLILDILSLNVDENELYPQLMNYPLYKAYEQGDLTEDEAAGALLGKAVKDLFDNADLGFLE